MENQLSNHTLSEKPSFISQKFPKSERLYHKKDIEQLFKTGQSDFLFPFKVLVLEKASDTNIVSSSFPRILISVSKRQFKRAHDRNRLKRQIREAYRTQKNNYNLSHIDCIGFISVAKEHQEYNFLYKRMSKILKKIAQPSPSN